MSTNGDGRQLRAEQFVGTGQAAWTVEGVGYVPAGAGEPVKAVKIRLIHGTGVTVVAIPSEAAAQFGLAMLNLARGQMSKNPVLLPDVIVAGPDDVPRGPDGG